MDTWQSRISSDYKVKNLVLDLKTWQENRYIDRSIWKSGIFSKTLLDLQRSQPQNPQKDTEVKQKPYEVTESERKCFEKEGLNPERWVPKLFEGLAIASLKLVETTTKKQIITFLKGIGNKKVQQSLKSLIRELKCLYVPSFNIEGFTDLPEEISKRKDYLLKNKDEGDKTMFNELQDQLECFVWKRHQSPKSSYQYLICVTTFCLFGLDINELSFGNGLREGDIQKLSVSLRENLQQLSILGSLEEIQAYVFSVALGNCHQKAEVVRYVLAKLPDTICKEFVLCTRDNINLTELHQTVTAILSKKEDEQAYIEKQKFLAMHFNALFSRSISEVEIEEKSCEVRDSVRNLLEDLGLMKYYPKKLTYQDVTMLTEDALKDINETPSTLPELPWYFMRRLIGLNSTIREKGTVVGTERVENLCTENVNEQSEMDISFTWKDESSDDECEEHLNTEEQRTTSVVSSVHPLDLIYVIFLCADDFLRQELVDKMSKCQYAVPFILPTPTEKKDESDNELLNWGLQAISRTYSDENSQSITKTLVNLDCPLVSCLSLNINTPWKLRLLNEMLSPQQKAFWHEGLEGGERPQKVSEGLVEVAWHLPADPESDEFKTPVTFVNVRNDALNYPVVTKAISELATTSCIFTDHIDQATLTFLGHHFGKSELHKVILILLYNSEKELKISKTCKKLTNQLNLQDWQVIKCPLEESNFHMTYANIKKSLKVSFDKNNGRSDMVVSLEKVANYVRRTGCLKLDNSELPEGVSAAQQILKDISLGNSDSIKSEILPCQSDLATREEIGKHEKEICRQKKIEESDLIFEYVNREEEEKWSLQWKQLQYPISKTFNFFLECITKFSPRNKKYFLQSLKLGLNDRSIEFLQPLYEEYKKCRLEEKSEATNKKLRELNEQLAFNSLGIEHFFREMAVMYENIVALRTKVGSVEHNLDDVLDTLAKTMSDILLEGEAMEILDGDVVHSPLTWLKAVINHIENSAKVRIFKVSSLGAQSSGKSTLLNTVFGLKFPVSSGRCTRGAYMQLVKIEDKLAKQLQCDYLLVIDSEGLMSRVAKDDDYDNELATFVIGLSDLTLVVIKGEGNEMSDVLPIAIHVFLRMNVLGELQACHFIHQNMGAVDVENKMLIEIDTFVQLLDEKTRAAAQEARQNKYKRFTDVLQYDKEKDNTYVCGLWDGSPPMGRTNIKYSQTMQKLKASILEQLKQFSRSKNCSSLKDFADWIRKVWEAIKYESFVFSFRNVLAIEAYNKLTRIFNDKQWEIKMKMRTDMEEKKKEVQNVLITMGHEDNTKVMDKIETMIENTSESTNKFIKTSIKKLSSCLHHYFQCLGCQKEDCSEEVRNRQYLRDYKGDFDHDITRFFRALEDEVGQSARNLAIEMSVHQVGAKMDDILRTRVQEKISEITSSKIHTKEKLETEFEELWNNATTLILKKFPQKKLSETQIKTAVQNAIKSSLGSDQFRYIQKTTGEPDASVTFTLRQEHANGGCKLPPHIFRLLRRQTENIFQRASVHFRRLENGREFEPKHAEILFKDVQRQIDQIKETGIETTLDYKVELMMNLEKIAGQMFIINQKTYEESSSRKSLLEEKRPAYHEVFSLATRGGDKAKEFSKIILRIVQDNLQSKMTCTELLQIVREHPNGGIFKSAHDLKFTSLLALGIQYSGTRIHPLPIRLYKRIIMEEIRKKCVAYLQDKNGLKNYAVDVLRKIILELQIAIHMARRSSCENKDFIGTLFSNMNGLKKPYSDIEAYKLVPIDNVSEFASALVTLLGGTIQNQVKADIRSWNVSEIVDRKGLTKFTFDEVIDCLICSSFNGYITSENQEFIITSRYIPDNNKDLLNHDCNEGTDSGTIQLVMDKLVADDMPFYNRQRLRSGDSTKSKSKTKDVSQPTTTTYSRRRRRNRRKAKPPMPMQGKGKPTS